MKDTDQILYSAGETIEYARLHLEQQGEIIRLEAAERTASPCPGVVLPAGTMPQFAASINPLSK